MGFWTWHDIQLNNNLFYLSLFQRKRLGFAGISIKMVFDNNRNFNRLAVIDNHIGIVIFIAGIFDCDDKIRKIRQNK